MIANFLAKIGGFAYGFFLLPQIYSSTSPETTVQIYSFVAILLWCSADLGLTEALKNKLIKENCIVEDNYLTSVFSSFMLTSLLYLACVGAFFSLVSDGYDLKKILFVIFIAIFTIPQKYFREYLTAQNAIDKYSYIRFISMAICALPSIIYCQAYQLDFYSALLLLNCFNILSTILVIGYCRNILTWNIGSLKNFELGLQDQDAVKIAIYLFFYGIFTVGLQDSSILYLERLFPPLTVANINIILRACQYIIVLNSLIILPLWPYIHRKSSKTGILIIIEKVFFISIIFNCLFFLALYMGREPIFSYLSAGESTAMPLLEGIIFIYCFTRSLALVCSAFLKVVGLFDWLVIFAGIEFVLMLISIAIFYFLQPQVEVLFISWAIFAVILRIVVPFYLIRQVRSK